jgi:polysaccharide deacetylase 2 family uncharacterized protein YibQ
MEFLSTAHQTIQRVLHHHLPPPKDKEPAITSLPVMIGNKKSLKDPFLQGMIAVALIYAGIFGWVALNANDSLRRYEEQFPFYIAQVAHPEPVAMPEPYVHPISPNSITEPVQPAAIENTQPGTPEEPHAAVVIPTGPLKPAPIEGLYQQTPAGKLPKISSDGLTPFEAYKRPFVYQNKPVIVLAIKNYGLSAEDSEQVLALPADVSFILSPYADNPDLWQKKAREAGHEVWLSLPMENTRFLQEDPGPLALLSHSSTPENQKKLDTLLGITTGYSGIVAETDKAFLDMHAMLDGLISSVFARGLGYVEMNTAGSEFLETIAVQKNAPFISLDQDGINGSSDLDAIEQKAAAQGAYIVATELTPKNLKFLHGWTVSLTGKATLAPLSAAASGAIPKKTPQPETAPAAIEVAPMEAAPAEEGHH